MLVPVMPAKFNKILSWIGAALLGYFLAGWIIQLWS